MDLQQRIYYSQNREDIILEAFFPNQQSGFYVDVGANDPVVDSVTKLFYDHGWNGINIEPIQRHYESLEALRPRDINLNIGVGKEPATLKFHEYTNGDGLSTFSNDIAAGYAESGAEVYANIQDYEVKVLTLADVFKQQQVTKINFMKVDVEGFEYDVLAGNDWELYRPEVICIEANHIVQDWRPIFKTADYELAFFDGLNEYYVDARTNKAADFDYVQRVVIDENGGLRSSDYQHMQDLQGVIATEKQAVLDAHLRLQAALQSHAQITEAHQKLLSDNHENHMRAVNAERALRNPVLFSLYQLRRLNRATLYQLGRKKHSPPYTPDELSQQDSLTKALTKTQSEKQRLVIIQKLARLETNRLERIYRAAAHRPFMLRVYIRFTTVLKSVLRRLR